MHDIRMTDPPYILKPVPRLPSSAQSPERKRLPDDPLLLNLNPSTAVDALAAATGSLRLCLDGATPSERDFALRAAVASRNIWDWLEELTEWEWPTEGGSAGFEPPSRTGRKLFDTSNMDSSSIETSGQYLGCLRVEHVLEYEQRIDQIHGDMDRLSVEEIKAHVMTNYIIPLSRPGTPSSIRSGISMRTTFNRMEDLTAVVTAIVVQTLPNLAKLSRLLQVWSIRIRVLHRIPPLLAALGEAEVALASGWNAISKRQANVEQLESARDIGPPTLTRDDFLVMKTVLEKRVAKPGRTLDYMLDCLEGLADTLPEDWLDRMEVSEQSYANWVATCEKRIRETEWAKGVHLRAPSLAPAPQTLKTRPSHESIPEISIEEHDDSIFEGADESVLSLDSNDDYRTPRFQPPTPIPEEDVDTSPIKKSQTRRWDDPDDLSSPISPVVDQPELPPLRTSLRRGSDASQGSTIIHQLSSPFDDASSELPEVSASPLVPKSRIREAEYLDASPPSSPPDVDDSRETSINLLDHSVGHNSTIDDDSLRPDTPPDEASMDFEEPFSVSEIASPTFRRDSSGESQLRHQITRIIESIPARIKLAQEPPKIDLNPPDLQLPKIRKKPSIDRFRRSASAMSAASAISSRAGTPSFTLSPAKTSRRQRGQQEIKVYHLSRSTGEAPIKLHIRCVGENGERVMVRVGGGWADLSEYLKEYATHHGRRSAGTDSAKKVEVRDLPHIVSNGRATGSSPSIPNPRPASALDSPTTPLTVRKSRRSTGTNDNPNLRPKTPIVHNDVDEDSALTEDFNRSRSNSRLSWKEDDSSFLGLAGPSGKRVEMSEENKAWVESVKEKVRIASGERKVSGADDKARFGQMGKVGGTKRLFPRTESRGERYSDTRVDRPTESSLNKRAESSLSKRAESSLGKRAESSLSRRAESRADRR